MKLISRLWGLISILFESSPVTLKANVLSGEIITNIEKEIQKILREPNSVKHIEEYDGDKRFFGIQSNSVNWNQIYKDVMLNFDFEDYLEYEWFILYGEISNSAKGSGGGWHRDSIFSELKVIIYLSDVLTLDEGPFEYLPGSAERIEKIKDQFGRLLNKNWLRRDSFITEFKSLLGPRGYAFAVDTSHLHRGAPVKSSRRAVTIYCYKKSVPQHMRKYL